MIDELVQIRRDICKDCPTPCHEYQTGTISHEDPCVRCPLGIWHHIDGEDCGGRYAPPVHPEAAGLVAGGAGTELKAFLGRFGIHASGSCSCNIYAAEMDRLGPDWCEANLQMIVDWISAEAKTRKIPVPSLVIRQVVIGAIKRARRKAGASILHR